MSELTNSLRVGLIGTGRTSDLYLKTLAKLDAVEIPLDWLDMSRVHDGVGGGQSTAASVASNDAVGEWVAIRR